MTTVHGPTVGRRRLRSALRAARERAGYTQEQVIGAMDWSLSKLIRIEAGTVSISTNDLKALLSHYRLTDPEQVSELLELARVARRRTWWSQYKETLPAPFIAYIGLELEASTLSFFQSSGIPGLLQTEGYARATVAAAATTSTVFPIDESEIETRVAVRMRRQREMLSRPEPPQVNVVLDEAVLHRQTGGPACIREQLRHLVAMGSEPSMSIQVLPFTAGTYASQGSFIVLDFPGSDDAPVVYLEGVLAQDIVDRPDLVAPYQQTFQRLREMSLGRDESIATIDRIARQIG
ncbi:helix-turn-helix transcriptional regulator [Polymorphospora sp. NPDC051019]|uniref:helix-turn-helix domain-containing protein n=1 Tax=Polymorphospora sp. NPDC051019 TaxID=3155725 RepID=UPI0034123EEA